MKKSQLKIVFFCSTAFLICVLVPACIIAAPVRNTVNLNGTWQIAQGSMDSKPHNFDAAVPVPGLVDMAKPASEDVGKVSNKRQAFWYRRTFEIDGDIPAVAVLKINKAKYGTKVFLNGKAVAEHLPSFTPGYFDIKEYLKGNGQTNELLVRVGANRESLPEGMPGGWDFEKYLYIPGIYDSVGIILTGPAHIRNIQTVPDIESKTVKIVAEIKAASQSTTTALQCSVTAADSGKQAGSAKSQPVMIPAGEIAKIELKVPIRDCKLWSPEKPFLYKLRATTSSDVFETRFAMRSFRFDPDSGRAVLNGRPYMMRGTNVCIYRFFEDAARGDKPWREEWVRRLHRKFKSMHWNSIRYCIGFPPDFWYDIADEEGFLIQDEFPIWLLSRAPEEPLADYIIPQYTAWMRQRWNHPCVVIWDAQNESHTAETGKALEVVRHLDLSNRPWENGWAEPQSPTDCVESHPYKFIRTWQDKEPFRLAEMPRVSPVPNLNNSQKKFNVPIINNEYGWLWLNRDGAPTTLTVKIYESLGLWPGSTPDRRFETYARYLAALTEFWRAHRECAAVMHFCGLGYSRPGFEERPLGGATSDHFIDLEKLTFEPHFEKYLRQAFAPVGVMLDFWASQVPPGRSRQVKVFLINDLYEDWRGNITLELSRAGEVVAVQETACTVEQLGRTIVDFEQVFPEEPGRYRITAQITNPGGETVQSIRDFTIKKPKK